METSFLLRREAWEITLILFACMLLCITLGRMAGKKIFPEREKNEHTLSSLFAIMGLMLAFTFGMSLSRYEKRVDIVLNESNEIGTAILRCDIYPEEYRQQLKADFKEYVEARIAYFEAGVDTHKTLVARRAGQAISSRIWKRVAELSANPSISPVATMQMVPALNAVIDTAEMRWYITLNKVPEPVLWMLFSLVCICFFLMGYSVSAKKMDRVSTLGVCLMLCAVVYLVIDIDRPRRGIVTMQQSNVAILELRKMFE